MMKAKKSGSLYVLQGTTVTGLAALSSSSMSDSEITRLWHCRLGHVPSPRLRDFFFYWNVGVCT